MTRRDLLKGLLCAPLGYFAKPSEKPESGRVCREEKIEAPHALYRDSRFAIGDLTIQISDEHGRWIQIYPAG